MAIVEVHIHNNVDLDSITLKLNNIMGALEDLQAKLVALTEKVAALQTAVDSEQQQITDLLATNAQVVSDLTAQNEILKAQIANGATPEQLQAVSNSLQATIDSIATAQTDLEATV